MDRHLNSETSSPWGLQRSLEWGGKGGGGGGGEKPYSKYLCTSNQRHNKHKPVRNRVVQCALVSTALIQFTSIKSSLSSMTFYKRDSKLNNLIIQSLFLKECFEITRGST